MSLLSDEAIMRIAFDQALKGRSIGEVPVGAVLVDNKGEIISTAHNLCETLKDPTAHAEIIVIREATRKLSNIRTEGSTLYVTLEPCSMCIGAMVLARINRLVFGARDPKSGAVVSKYNIGVDNKLNHTLDVAEGILKEDCSYILSEFFKGLRA